MAGYNRRGRKTASGLRSQLKTTARRRIQTHVRRKGHNASQWNRMRRRKLNGTITRKGRSGWLV